MVTDTDMSMIQEHMPVFCSLGSQVGTVGHVEGDRIKLTEGGSPDGMRHYIPTSIIAFVDHHVHLDKTADEVKAMWANE